MIATNIFTLVSNKNNKQACLVNLLHLTSLRIKRIIESKNNAGINKVPTLIEIKKSHVSFMNSYFKPFVITNYEYMKILPSSNNVTLNNIVQFIITSGSGEFFNDMIFHIKLSDPKPSNGNIPYRWCAYPGERLCSEVEFIINGNVLEKYYDHDYSLFRKFELAPDDECNYNTCMGQENAVNSRNCELNKKSFQTFNVSHGDLELFIPLIFWFNKSPQDSFFFGCTRWGQKYINIDLAEQGKLVCQNIKGNNIDNALKNVEIKSCELYVRNMYMNYDVLDLYINQLVCNVIYIRQRHIERVYKESGKMHLSRKFLIKNLFIGFRPVSNIDYSNNSLHYLDYWHCFSQINKCLTKNTIDYKQERVVNNFSINYYDDVIYDEFPNKINDDINTNTYMISFDMINMPFVGAIYPLKASDCVCLDYDSSAVSKPISNNNPVDIIVVKKKVNYLIVSDGSAVLRYST